MTKITYEKKEDSFKLKAVGHAGYANVGQDIVCAAVSTLLQTLAYRVMDLTLNYTYVVRNGYLYIEANCKDAMECFYTILGGLEMLEHDYPNHVVVTGGCPIFNDFDE